MSYFQYFIKYYSIKLNFIFNEKYIYLHNRNERFRLKNENNITLLSIILSKILVKKKKKERKKRHVKILIKRFSTGRKT